MLVMLVGTVAGCGKAGFRRASVSGQVVCDAEPIATGTVLFVPAVGTTGQPVQAVIENGKYELSSDRGPAVGKHTVQITAMKKTGKKIKTIMNEEAEEVVQFVAPRFNTESELTAEIHPGKNEVNFEVSSK
jgi:hypothetical protein